MKSKVISLSAISAAFIAIFLSVGAYIEAVDLFCIVIASAFVVLPLYYKSFKGSILAYLSGGIIAFLISGFNILSLVFPCYLLFSGIYPIVSVFMREKKVKPYIIYLLGVVWCVAAFYGAYFYYTLVMKGVLDDLPRWLEDSLLYFIGAFGVVFYIVFDKFIVVVKAVSDMYLKRIIKK